MNCRLRSKVRILTAAQWVQELSAQKLRPQKRRPGEAVGTDGQAFRTFARAEGVTIELTAKVLRRSNVDILGFQTSHSRTPHVSGQLFHRAGHGQRLIVFCSRRTPIVIFCCWKQGFSFLAVEHPGKWPHGRAHRKLELVPAKAAGCVAHAPGSKPRNQFQNDFNGNELVHFLCVSFPLSLRLQEPYASAAVLHFATDHKRKLRWLAHFYSFLWFESLRDDRHVKRFARDALRYRDEVFCTAAKIVHRIREDADKLASPEGLKEGEVAYSTLHIRRGDFQFKAAKIPMEEIVETAGELLRPGELLYVSTDEQVREVLPPRINSTFKLPRLLVWLGHFVLGSASQGWARRQDLGRLSQPVGPEETCES